MACLHAVCFQYSLIIFINTICRILKSMEAIGHIVDQQLSSILGTNYRSTNGTIRNNSCSVLLKQLER